MINIKSLGSFASDMEFYRVNFDEEIFFHVLLDTINLLTATCITFAAKKLSLKSSIAYFKRMCCKYLTDLMNRLKWYLVDALSARCFNLQ